MPVFDSKSHDFRHFFRWLLPADFHHRVVLLTEPVNKKTGRTKKWRRQKRNFRHQLKPHFAWLPAADFNFFQNFFFDFGKKLLEPPT